MLGFFRQMGLEVGGELENNHCRAISLFLVAVCTTHEHLCSEDGVGNGILGVLAIPALVFFSTKWTKQKWPQELHRKLWSCCNFQGKKVPQIAAEKKPRKQWEGDWDKLTGREHFWRNQGKLLTKSAQLSCVTFFLGLFAVKIYCKHLMHFMHLFYFFSAFFAPAKDL